MGSLSFEFCLPSETADVEATMKCCVGFILRTISITSFTLTLCLWSASSSAQARLPVHPPRKTTNSNFSKCWASIELLCNLVDLGLCNVGFISYAATSNPAAMRCNVRYEPIFPEAPKMAILPMYDELLRALLFS